MCYNHHLSYPQKGDSRLHLPVIGAVMAAALLVVLPFAFFGCPSGHDFEFHLSSWMETVSQWKQAIVYPRWAALAHFGYGEPRFIFYPPLSWMLGAAVGVFFPWHIAPAVFVWIMLSLGGYSMYLLAREWLPHGDAIAAAALYTVNPYHIVVVYWRSAYAELLADALFPLLLLWTWRARTEPRRAFVPLALTLTAIWLSNAPAAVIATYSFVLLTVVFAVIDKNPRIVPYAGAALVLAMGLAAFYIIPAAWEQKWVNIGQVLSPGVRPEDNFLFTTIADPEHTVFNLLVSLVAAGEIAILALAILLSRDGRRRRRELWRALVIWAAVSALLMFRIANPLWQHLPKLKFVQIPWRWLVPLNVAFAILVSAAIRRPLVRVLFLGFFAVALLALSSRVLPPWWDHAQDIAAMHHAVASGKGYEGTDEYVPKDGDPYELKENAPRVGVLTREGTEVPGTAADIESWRPEQRAFTVEVSHPSELILRLLNYPAWHANVNGHAVEIETADVTGQMVIPLPAGRNRVTLRFVRTPDRTMGIAISLLSLIVVILLYRRTPAVTGEEAVGH